MADETKVTQETTTTGGNAGKAEETTKTTQTEDKAKESTPKAKTEEEIRAELSKEYEKIADKRVTDALKKRDKEWEDKNAKAKLTEEERTQIEEQERLQAQAKKDLD